MNVLLVIGNIGIVGVTAAILKDPHWAGGLALLYAPIAIALEIWRKVR